MTIDDLDETKATFSHAGKRESRFTSIEIFHRSGVHKVTRDMMPFTVGRSQEKCHLVLTNKQASNKHFALVMRDGIVGLIDSSTHGTWVQLGRSEAVQIKNSFLPLIGSGRIQAGCEIQGETPDSLRFRVHTKAA